MQLQAARSGALKGTVRVPGDKSISHRALMFAAMAVGESKIDGLLEGEDVLATAHALRALGVPADRHGPGSWTVHGVGVGGLAEPSSVLDMGNAGTGARLMLGLLAGHGFTSVMTGDASLCARPMARVMTPLAEMGAVFTGRSGNRLPIAITGNRDLLPLTYASPVASAQVKSAILLAGLHATGITTVTEPLASRDHTERMLSYLGAVVTSEPTPQGGLTVSVTGRPELHPGSFQVPGDPSSAAFPLAAAAATEGSRVLIEAVCVNPLRSGLITTLAEMGARIEYRDQRAVGGEIVADLLVQGGDLAGVDVPPERAPSMIDEYPVLAVAAGLAHGTTRMRGLSELRVKESDRLAVMAEGLAACGVEVDVEGDDLIVHGSGGRPLAGGATVDARLDHRIAMSFLVLGGLAARPVRVQGAEAILTSFPDFVAAMNGLGTEILEPGP